VYQETRVSSAKYMRGAKPSRVYNIYIQGYYWYW